MGKYLSVICTTLLLFFVLGPLTAYAVDPEAILGEWQVESQEADATRVTVYRCDDKYCGKISYLEDPETLDSKNPDESKRDRKLLGLDFVWGFHFEDDEWVDGKIYDPRSGKTYDCKMWFEDNSRDVLNVKGYVLFIGKTSTWYRVQ